MMSARISTLAVGVLTMIAPVLAHAQLVSTGAAAAGGRDTRWDVSTNGGSTWEQAYLVTAIPEQWTNGAPGGTWISSSPRGTGGGGAYRVRSLFTLALGDVFTFRFRCAADDGPVAFFINGAAQQGNPCPNTWSWGAMTSVDASNFRDGQNSIEFAFAGNNFTDGIAVEIANATLTPGNPSVVPEPATLALFASGLFGLGVVARRRRRA